MVPALPGFASWGRKGHYTPPRALSGGLAVGWWERELKGGRELVAARQLPSGRAAGTVQPKRLSCTGVSELGAAGRK